MSAVAASRDPAVLGADLESAMTASFVQNAVVVGLRVVVSGRRRVLMALSRHMPLVTAGIALRTGRHKSDGEPASYLFGTGLDDREGHPRWLMVGTARVGAAIEIEVADVGRGDTPVPEAQKSMDWRKVFARRARQDARRVGELEERLKRIRGGIPHVVPWTEANPARRGLRVSLNGETLGCAAVGHPGTLTVDVVGLRRTVRQRFFLNIHGGERLGPLVWRWFEWPWGDRRLREGDRVRIEVISPRGIVPGRVREVSVTEPRTEEEVLSALEELRSHQRPEWRASQAARMLAFEKKKPARRRYPGGRLVR